MSTKPDKPSPSRRVPSRRGIPARPAAPPSENAVPILMSLQEVARALNIGRRTLERHILKGLFPEPDARIGKLNRWKPQTVNGWIDGQA